MKLRHLGLIRFMQKILVTIPLGNYNDWNFIYNMEWMNSKAIQFIRHNTVCILLICFLTYYISNTILILNISPDTSLLDQTFSYTSIWQYIIMKVVVLSMSLKIILAETYLMVKWIAVLWSYRKWGLWTRAYNGTNLSYFYCDR